MKKLSNAELMILQIISLLDKVSGYEINVYVSKMNYQKWADIGKTSVYSALKKLEKKDFVLLTIDTNKVGKGPIPKKYSITESGIIRMKQEMLATIISENERSKRLNLVISSIQILENNKILQAFEERFVNLEKENQRLSNQLTEYKNCIPIGGELLYRKLISSIENELSFALTIINKFKKENDK